MHQLASSQSATWNILSEGQQTAPIVISSPHSGRDYPADFIAASQLHLNDLRRSEDCYIDELFGAAAQPLGVPLLHANFPRAWLDVNRQPWELDPQMFSGPLPDWVITDTQKLRSGYGTIARCVSPELEIYDGPLDFKDIHQRIQSCHYGYHNCLQDLVSKTIDQFGTCLLIDAHSMPAHGAGSQTAKIGPAEIVLGNNHGRSCSADLMTAASKTFEAAGYSVQRNIPYAGGYTTCHYSNLPNVVTLQIEIRRDLYMNQASYERLKSFDVISQTLMRMLEQFSMRWKHLIK